MSTIIEPTVGRIVWLYHDTELVPGGFNRPVKGEPLAAIIASVVDSGAGIVHLAAFDAFGVQHAMPYVQLVQDGQNPPAGGRYATWMPYQIGQAKKTENAQQPAPGAAHPGYSTMQPHQQRVVDERTELDDKLSKLVGFFGSALFSTLPGAEQKRLRAQAEAMRTYSGILADRVAAFAPA